MTKPVVIEFISDYPKEGSKHYYIGKSRKDILDVAYKGSESKLYNFLKEHTKKISIKEAEKLNLGFYEDGYRAVLSGSKAFKLKTPERPRGHNKI